MKFNYNDGGRSKYFKNKASDCVVRAIAIASDSDYIKIFNDIEMSMNRFSVRGREKGSPDKGVNRHKVYDKYLKEVIGMKWQPTMYFGSGCKVHLKADELPKGKIICRCSRHLVAVIDGVINDNHDCSRDEKRCVYGYYYFP